MFVQFAPMSLILLLVIAVLGCGCRSGVTAPSANTVQPQQNQTQQETASSNQHDAPHHQTSNGLAKEDLVGWYILGDGLGLNDSLLLSETGEFQFHSSNCGATRGKSTGHWIIEGDEITLQPLVESGTLKQTRIRRLHVYRDEQSFILVASSSLDDFRSVGPKITNCFTRCVQREN